MDRAANTKGRVRERQDPYIHIAPIYATRPDHAANSDAVTPWRDTVVPDAVQQSIFSIDVEDWFNLSGTGVEPPPSEWDRLESRLERNLRSLLDLLAEGGSTATCFFVGYFAKRFPHLVREAMAAGHEIASHSYYHRLVYDLSPDEFLEDALASRKLLEDISGRPVRGFRAPAFSVTEATPWFFDKVAEAGYRYDSSVFPAHHQTGGLRTKELGPHSLQTSAGTLAEFPISTVPIFGTPMCFFGGGYLRLFPYSVIRMMGQRALQEERPIVLYVHPREIDPDQPRLPLSRRRRFTCYVNLRSTGPKIRQILRDFSMSSFEDYISKQAVS
jgi:polysaccharide deacetylase family protein (PEP-CTERM system associated)